MLLSNSHKLCSHHRNQRSTVSASWKKSHSIRSHSPFSSQRPAICCDMCQDLVSFYYQIMFHCLNEPFQPAVDERLSCFYSWLLWNMLLGTFVHKFLWMHVFTSLDYITRNGIAESYENSMFNILRNCQDCFPKQLHHFTVTAAVYEGSSLSTFWAVFVLVYLSYYYHPGGYKIDPLAL